ncbi:hypothetical protein [Agrococcus baldri]|uniref:Uncharacterized protein n=1 Tax=Agrococcus baldri TaxID=153730 RepID=A0AA87RCE7_9MICO|nr:hypothetical protein [Agrococcus baldri]GEK80449.1 hypothetical protein ABA31_18000 [Agrococcus baldri]
MTALAARLLAPVMPLPTPADPAERAEVQRARFRSASAWLVAGVFGAQFAVTGLMLAETRTGGWAWAGATAGLTLGMLVVGSAQLVLHARVRPGRSAAAWGIAAAVVLGLLLAPLNGFLSFVFGQGFVFMPLVVAGLGVMLLAFDPSMRAAAPRPVRGAALGGGVALAVLALGVLDGLVLLPLTLAAPMPLDEIYAALAAAGEDHGVGVVVWWAAIWAVAIGLLAAGLLRNRRAEAGTLGALLAATVLAMTALPLTQFPMGMSLGDTVAIAGGFSFAFPAVQLVLVALTAVASWLLIGASRR